MISLWKQFWLLLWKSYIIKKKQKIWLLLEITIPTLLFALLVIILTCNFDVLSSTCHYDAKAFPSAGVLPFLHSIFCSLSNNCQGSPTTSDDTYTINEPRDNESIVIGLVRWLVSVTKIIGGDPDGWNAIFNELAEVIHVVATVGPGSFGTLAIPLATFFPSHDAMIKMAYRDLNFPKSDAQMLNNVSVKPGFFLHAYEAYQEYNKDHSSYMLERLFNDDINFFCNATILEDSFTDENGEIEKLKLCDRVKYRDLLPLLIQLDVDRDKVAKATVSSFVEQLGQTTLGAELVASRGEKIKGAFNEVVERLPPFDFTPLFGSTDDLLNAIFCGDFYAALNHNTGTPKQEVNSMLDDFQNRVRQFIMKLTPGQTHDDHGVVKCGDLIVKKSNACEILDVFALSGQGGVKTAFNGYILVTPDTPLSRELVHRLEEPLRKLSYFKDLIFDFTQIASPLQDAIAKSDLNRAAQVIEAFLPSGPGSNGTATLSWALKHLFANSKDPNSAFEALKTLSTKFLGLADCFRYDRFVFVQNETELELQAMCLSNFDLYFTGIVLPETDAVDNSTRPSDYVEFKIRHQHKLVDSTDYLIDRPTRYINRDDPFTDLKYLTWGFSFLQEAIERNLIEMYTNTSIDSGIYSQQEPYPCVQQTWFNVTVFLSLFLILSWMIPSALLVKSIVWEKEMRLKEMMRIMGLGDMIHWVAWATQNFINNMVAIIIIACLLKYGKVLANTDISLIFLLLITFSIACIAQCLLLTTFFSRANIATAVSALLFFLFFVPFQLSMKARSVLFTTFTLVFPQTAVGYGITMIANADGVGTASWEMIDDISMDAFGINYLKIILALVIDTVIYVVLAWYISAVFPGTYGVPQPWNFFMKRTYWLNTVDETIMQGGDRSRNYAVVGGNTSENGEISDTVETEPELPLAVDIVDMEKKYGSHKALKKLSVKFYESQITCLLGHNGAGKTTTISILSGLFPPSSGTAWVYGHDIRTSMNTIRDNLGVCPQHNVLFDMMTVEEQLRFFGALKGISISELDAEMEEILFDIGLQHKRDFRASELSGGMKRKLCIGIALIGGSKLIILDEPTAGIDAHARRSIWQLLLKHKKDRTMILTTHHLDEADVLADRVVIVADGKLRAAGSTLFLKKRFGNGYQLTIARTMNSKPSDTDSIHYSSSPASRDEICAIIKRHSAGQGTLVDDLGTEIHFKLPLDMPAISMKDLFAELEDRKTELELDSFGVSAPTLQQVFISTAAEPEQPVPEKPKSCWERVKESRFYQWFMRRYNVNTTSTNGINSSSAENLAREELSRHESDFTHPAVRYVDSDFALNLHHAAALFVKRWHNSRRSLLQLFCLLICPVLLFLCAELYSRLQRHLSTLSYEVSEDPLYLTPVNYGNGTQVYFAVWNRNHTESLDALTSMMAPPGIGCRCMTDIDLYNNTFDQCVQGYAHGGLNIDDDDPSKIPFNVPQRCGCTTSGWNCTLDDYPLKQLQNFTLNTTDFVWDLNYRNITQFRLMTSENTTKNRDVMLGGFTFGHENVQALNLFDVSHSVIGFQAILKSLNSSTALWKLDWRTPTAHVNWSTVTDPFAPKNLTVTNFVADSLPRLDTAENNKIWFNNKAWASLPINTNSYHNSLLRALATDTAPETIGIMAINHPMNETVEGAVGDSQQLQKTIIFRVVIMVLVLSFLPASTCILLVEERISYSRHLQSVFGVSPWMYWVTNFVYDYVIMMFCSFLVIGVYVLIEVPVFTYSMNAFFGSIMLFAIYHACALPFVYVLQLAFGVPAVAYALIGIGLFFIGVVSSMTIILLENLISADETLVRAHSICSIVFLVLPQYNLGIAVSRLNFVYGVYQTAEKYLDSIGRHDMLSEVPLPDITEWQYMGKHLVALFIGAIAFTCILMAMEYHQILLKFYQKRERALTSKLLAEHELSEKQLDEDVEREQITVEEIENVDDYGLVVRHLAKAYNNEFLAVKGLSFAARKGECFGLLGVNGAGKTTTFSMLTGRLPIGGGDAFIRGNSVGTGGFSSFRLLGYCPQFDALNLRLTAREQLAFFARIRGIRECDIPKTVDWAIAKMHLNAYATKVSGAYSGGNKRKLSAAIALVADPPVVLLDEPSAGMDVASQSFMWQLILQLRRSDRTVILTSHSMEECEAVCSRTAIMVDGQFKCLGSIQHLKQRFGQGYTLTVKLAPTGNGETAKHFVLKHVPGSSFASQHCQTMFFRIDSDKCNLSTAFDGIARLHEAVPVEDYALSQTTLDDVFVTFAAAAVEPSPTSADEVIGEAMMPLN
uniref:ABC transporter domain-containing protein n=2 Tax=Panagrellus redivivus TaxID=6233 RepID=A0A7E4VBK1_PANRE